MDGTITNPSAKLQHPGGLLVRFCGLVAVGVRYCTFSGFIRFVVCKFLCTFALAMTKDNVLHSTHEYGRTELACIYSPRLTPQAAWRKLRLWISLNRELSLELTALGYDGHHRTFTPRMVQAITHYLGEP